MSISITKVGSGIGTTRLLGLAPPLYSGESFNLPTIHCIVKAYKNEWQLRVHFDQYNLCKDDMKK